MANPPNYLDFLVAVDDHIFSTNVDYIHDWSGLHKIAQEAGLETPQLPQAARWTGEMYHHGYLRLETLGRGYENDVPSGPFTDGDLQRLREFRITPLGREEADRVRRQRREAATDAVLGLRFPDLSQLAANDGQLRAISGPWQHLQQAIDHEQWDRAVGSAKELVEAACKVAISLAGLDVPSGDELPTLVRKALEASGGGDAADDLSRSLISTTQRLAQLRNDVGTGHGREIQPEISERSGRLAATAAAAVASYVLSRTTGG